MSQNTFWRGVLGGLLCLALATPVRAQNGSGKPIIGYKGSGNTVSGNTGSSSAAAASGAVVGAAGVVAIVTLVLTHKKRITGCVNAHSEGMSITDEHDKQTYEMLGSTTDFRAGERVNLQVKRIKSEDKGGAPIWQVEKLIKDYGSCD